MAHSEVMVWGDDDMDWIEAQNGPVSTIVAPDGAIISSNGIETTYIHPDGSIEHFDNSIEVIGENNG